MQHTKYYSHASYNGAAHEDGSRAAHEIELACSARKITLVSHASLVRVTQQKYYMRAAACECQLRNELYCS